MNDKYINHNVQDRFVKEEVLRNAYLHYEESLNPTAKTFVTLEDGFELGIVSSQVPEIARAVSSILTNSLEDAKYTNGGYLPPDVVERVQLEIISPYGISKLWGTTGHRFVLSRPAEAGMREIVGSILVARSKDTIFFFTGRYNNIKHSELAATVDLNQPVDTNPDQKWFDKFAFPDLERFKPLYYHHIANFVVVQKYRGQGLAKLLINSIVRYYARNHLAVHSHKVEHSQFLLCGQGFWQVGDPPWLPKMQKLGFYLRAGAESFFLEPEWHTLRPIIKDGKPISNIEYNQSYGLPAMYENFQPPPMQVSDLKNHLFDRIPKIIELSKNPRAKLQYFQAMYNFI
jgi:GNAT superfamily N-acetyltransferase